MPWTAKDAKKHCKDCDSSKWASIANAVLAQCQKSNGKDCEGKAVRIANSKSKLEDSVEILIQQAFEELETEEHKEGGDSLEEKAKSLREIIETNEDLPDVLKSEVIGFLDGKYITKGLEESKSLKKQSDPMQLKESPYKLEVLSELPITLESKDGRVISTLQMLRSGKFEHPWFGTLAFDDKIFDNMIKNFEAGIPYQEFALDFRHMPELGAAAWITRVFKERKRTKKCDLYFEVEWTPEGEKAVREKRFKFTSIEFHDNYKDNENGKMYGATILGGGLTNRPFIKGMKPIVMSEDGSVELEFDEILEKEDEETMKTLQEIKDEIKRLSDELTSLASKVVKDPEDKDSQKRLSEITEQLSELNKSIDEAEKAEAGRTKEVEDLRSKNAKLEETVSSVSTKLESVMTEREAEKKALYVERVERKLAEFKESGVPPAILEVVKPILLAENAEKIVVTLTDAEGKKDEITLMKTVAKIFEALPDDAKVKTGEKTRNLNDGMASSGSSETSVDDVRKYADDNKISFAEALIELSKKGKIPQD